MKKLFTMMVVSLCGTMAYAQTAISVKDATIAKGGTTNMEVVVNNPGNYTAFQFDLKLPKGVSVKDFKMNGSYGDDRKYENKCVDEGNNIYRFLSYDMKNATLSGTGTVANITLEAASDVAEGELDASETAALVVTPAGDPTDVASAVTAKINVSEGVSITIPDGGKLAMVSDKNLDFSGLTSMGVTAYICTGYDVAERSFWLMPITDVPANTPIVVKGDKGVSYSVPVGAANMICYPDNFLKGNATKTADVLWEEGYLNFGISQSKGSIGEMSQAKYTTLEAGKAYFHVPSSVVSKTSSNKVSFKMGDAGKLACVSDVDLDFSDVAGLQAFAVTAFDNGRNIWLMPVKNVSAGTPLLLRGEKAQSYEVPSSATQMAYSNMLDGNNTGADKVLNPEEGDYTIYGLSMSKGIFGTLSKATTFANGKAWLPVPTAFHNSLPASTRGYVTVSEKIVDYIVVSAKGILDGEDDGTTGISRVAAQSGKDVWYNLNGQRIDTPTKKGLYIKNGKKVIVK